LGQLLRSCPSQGTSAAPQQADDRRIKPVISSVPNSDPGDDPRGRMPAVTEQLTRYEKPSPCRPPATRFDAFPGARPEQIGILVKTRVINSNDEPCRHQLRRRHNTVPGKSATFTCLERSASLVRADRICPTSCASNHLVHLPMMDGCFKPKARCEKQTNSCRAR
jgi:hypothetical protein